MLAWEVMGLLGNCVGCGGRGEARMLELVEWVMVKRCVEGVGFCWELSMRVLDLKGICQLKEKSVYVRCCVWISDSMMEEAESTSSGFG